MKRIPVFVILVALFAAAFTPPADLQAQTSITVKTVTGGRLIMYDDSVTTTGTDSSQAFSLAGFQGTTLAALQFTNEVTIAPLDTTGTATFTGVSPSSPIYLPFAVEYEIFPTAATDVDSARITVEGSSDGIRWTVVDTVVNNSGTAARTQVNLDFNAKRFILYRFKALGLGSATGTSFRVRLYALKAD